MKHKFFFLAIMSFLLTISFGYSQNLDASKPLIYAQKLVDGVIKKNPDMLDVLFHVTPPSQEKNIVIASHITKTIGEASGDDDLGVMKTGKPLIEVQKDGVRIGVLVQLRDRMGHAIGALGLMYPYNPGQDQKKVLARSNAIRDNLARKIKDVQQLSVQN